MKITLQDIISCTTLSDFRKLQKRAMDELNEQHSVYKAQVTDAIKRNRPDYLK